MIRAVLHNPSTNETSIGDIQLLEIWRKDPLSVLWIDFYDHPKESTADILQSDFGLHFLAIQDAQLARHPPKIEFFENSTFIILKGLSAGTATMQFSTHQLALFTGAFFGV